jgi:hypothetical protein
MSELSTFNTIIAVLGSLGGGGLLVAAMSGWLGKLWADRILASEKAKWELQIAHYRTVSEQSLTQMKSEMELQSKNAHLKFSKLHEERLKVLGDNYRALSNLYLNVKHCVEPEFFGRKKPPEAELLATALTSYDEFKVFFELNKIYLPRDVEDKLQNFVYTSVKSLDEYRAHVDRLANGGHHPTSFNTLANSWHVSLLPELNAARESVSNAFRQLLSG